jgi:hypothetical protein
LFIVGFDNITFKSVTDTYGKTGMEHYTAFSGIKFSKEFLYECNVYNDYPSKQLLREPEHDWYELCKKDKEDGGGELARSLVKLKPIDTTRLTYSFAENAHIACDHVLRHVIKWGQKMIHTGRIIGLNTHAELLDRSGTKLHDMSHSTMEAMLTSDNTTGNGITFYQQHIVGMMNESRLRIKGTF